jgi:hypothetical protein
MKFWSQPSAVTEVVLRLWEIRKWVSKRFPLVSFKPISPPLITRAPQSLWKSKPLNKNSQIKSLLCHLIWKPPPNSPDSSKKALLSKWHSIPTDKRAVNRQSHKANLSKGSLSTIILGRNVMRTKKMFPSNWNKRFKFLSRLMNHRSSRKMRGCKLRRERGSYLETVISSHLGNLRMFKSLCQLRRNPILWLSRATLN